MLTRHATFRSCKMLDRKKSRWNGSADRYDADVAVLFSILIEIKICWQSLCSWFENKFSGFWSDLCLAGIMVFNQIDWIDALRTHCNLVNGNSIKWKSSYGNSSTGISHKPFLEVEYSPNQPTRRCRSVADFFKQNGAWTEIWLDESQRVLIGAKGENAYLAPETNEDKRFY